MTTIDKERAEALVDQWLNGDAGDTEIDDEGDTLRDLLDSEPEARAELVRLVAAALAKSRDELEVQ